MAFFTGQQIQVPQVSPELLMAPGRAYGRAFEKLGQSIAGAMERQELNRQKKEKTNAVSSILQNAYGMTKEEADIAAKAPDVAIDAQKFLRENQKFELEKQKAQEYSKNVAAQTALSEFKFEEAKREKEAELEVANFLQKKPDLKKKVQDTIVKKEVIARQLPAPQPTGGQFQVLDQSLIDQFSEPIQFSNQNLNIEQWINPEAKKIAGQISDKNQEITNLLLKKESLQNSKTPRGLRIKKEADIDRNINRLMSFTEKNGAKLQKMMSSGDITRANASLGLSSNELLEQALMAGVDDYTPLTPEPQVKTTEEKIEKEVPLTEKEAMDEARKTMTPEGYMKLQSLMASRAEAGLKQAKTESEIAVNVAKAQKDLEGDTKIGAEDKKTISLLYKIRGLGDTLKEIGINTGLSEKDAKGITIGEGNSTAWQKFLPTIITPEDFQRYENAAMAFTMAVLRDESGAVISVDEAKQKWNTLFPRPGEANNLELIKDKARLRQLEYDAIYVSMDKAAQKRLREHLPEMKYSGLSKKQAEIQAKSVRDKLGVDPKFKVNVINP